MTEIRVPDIGDAENVEVIELCVAPGDAVSPDDAILVIESDKASMEVPAGIAGTLEELLVGIGDAVQEGQSIARLRVAEEGTEGVADTFPASTAAGKAGAPSESRGQAGAPTESREQAGALTESREQADALTETRGRTGAQSRPEPPAGAPVSPRATDSAGTAGAAEPAGMPAQGEVVVSVPDIGDARDVVVIEVAIRPGEAVEEDGLAVVVESDKATMEIPAGVAGVVAAVHVREGDPVVEGTRLFTLKAADSSSAPGSAVSSADSGRTGADSRETGTPRTGQPEPSDTSVEPGDPTGRQTPGELPGRRETASGAPARTKSPPLAPAKPPGSEIREEQSPGARVYAGPATRRLARELGVSLTDMGGTGARGRIVKDDVKLFVKEAMTSPQTGSGAGGIPSVPVVDFARFGAVESMPLTRTRAAGARNLHASWLNIPHVTQHDEADVTELEAFRESLKPEAAERGVNLTPLPFIVKACCYALKDFPTFNASLDAGAGNYVLKRYYNIGFAVDSEQGLVVPVLKNADRKGIWELADEISQLAARVRAKRLAIDDVQGGTFSISSLGALGGTGFTPIVNAPEVAILGVARLATKPVWDGAQFQPRKLLPLSLSYDHRAINGAEAGRFVGHLSSLLNDIRRLSL